MNSETQNFEWLATESAPNNYPMKIINGTFVYRNQEDGLYIPSGGNISNGWGAMISTHIVGDDYKPLPDKLKISYFSFTENQFYKSTFDLPYDKILGLFEKGYSLIDEEERLTYEYIMCGVAPGGTVAVWLLGQGRITEVFVGQADPVDLDWKESLGFSPEKREKFVNAKINSNVSPDVREYISKHGLPVANWSTIFRNRYNWVPTFAVANPPDRISEILFVNGEQDFFKLPLDTTLPSVRAVPRQLTFLYSSPTGWSYLYVITFDETEIVESFAKIGSNQESLALEFEPQQPISSTQIRLRNDKEFITLKKFSIKKMD